MPSIRCRSSTLLSTDDVQVDEWRSENAVSSLNFFGGIVHVDAQGIAVTACTHTHLQFGCLFRRA